MSVGVCGCGWVARRVWVSLGGCECGGGWPGGCGWVARWVWVSVGECECVGGWPGGCGWVWVSVGKCGWVCQIREVELTMMEQMRAGTRRAIPSSPPKKKQRMNPTIVRMR